MICVSMTELVIRAGELDISLENESSLIHER